MLTNQQLEKAFAGRNFGTNNYAELLLEGLKKVATGYHNGMTMQNIMVEMKLAERREKDFLVLTDLGLVYLSHVMATAPKSKLLKQLSDDRDLLIQTVKFYHCHNLHDHVSDFTEIKHADPAVISGIYGKRAAQTLERIGIKVYENQNTY